MVRAACASTIPALFPSFANSHFGTPPFLFDTFEKHEFCVSPSKQKRKHFLFDTFQPFSPFLFATFELPFPRTRRFQEARGGHHNCQVKGNGYVSLSAKRLGCSSESRSRSASRARQATVGGKKPGTLCGLIGDFPLRRNEKLGLNAPQFGKKCENTRRMAPPLTGRTLKTFQTRMLAWFRAHQRDLPWRRSRDPYRIWVAEVMLQQTRIAAVMPYYQRFLARFPTVQILARAPEAEVLKLWSGLGYYSRARNLHRAAKIIVAQTRRTIPARTRRRARTSRNRRLHSCRGAEHRLRCPARGTRWQRRPRSCAHKSHPRRPARSEKLACPHRRRAKFARDASSWRLEPIAHGAGRGYLHPSIAALRRMSRSPPLPRLRSRSNRRNPRTAPQTRRNSHENRRRNSPRPTRPHAADSGPRRARHGSVLPHVAIPRRRSHAPCEGGTRKTSPRHTRHLGSLARSVARRSPRRHLSQHHPAPISRECRRTSETPPHPHPPAEKSKQAPDLQRHPQNRRRSGR